jgi:hypothetical protein
MPIRRLPCQRPLAHPAKAEDKTFLGSYNTFYWFRCDEGGLFEGGTQQFSVGGGYFGDGE